MVAVFIPIFVSALETPTTALTKADKTTYNLSIDSSDSIIGCELVLRAHKKKKKVVNGQGKVLFTKTVQAQPLTLQALDISNIRGTKGKEKVYFVADLSCSGGEVSSEVFSRKFKVKNSNTFPKFGTWLAQFGESLGSNFSITQAFPSLQFSKLTDFQDPDDGTNRFFVLEQTGKIYHFINDSATATRTLYLDISFKVAVGVENGLLGLAFHPNFSTNRYFYIHYINTSGQSVISRYEADQSDPSIADSNSELILLTISKAENYHHGGQLAFGPDGYLYSSIGDGGPQGDPLNRGQNRNELLGSLLRIDVDTTSNGLNYGIPSDNPFVGKSVKVREELFAYGFRNPWRFSFDSVNGNIWLADVGLSSREEVNLVVKGGNYGWKIFEGNVCLEGAIACASKKFKKPVYEYPRNLGQSITGGYVYRGTALPSLIGRYLYADFLTGKIWALKYENNKATVITLVDTSLFISSFGQDKDGEVYILSYSGKIYKLSE